MENSGDSFLGNLKIPSAYLYNSFVEIIDYKKVSKVYKLKVVYRDGDESRERKSDFIRKIPVIYRTFLEKHPELVW